MDSLFQGVSFSQQAFFRFHVYISMLVFGGVHSDIVCLSWISESARFHVEAEPEGGSWVMNFP